MVFFERVDLCLQIFFFCSNIVGMVYSHWFLHTANQYFVSLRFVFWFVWSLHSRAYNHSAYTHDYIRSSSEQKKKQTELIHTRKMKQSMIKRSNQIVSSIIQSVEYIQTYSV